MLDFSYAVKEKIVEDHDVIDEAIKDEAEVRLRPESLGKTHATDFALGLYRLFHPSWNRLPSE